MRSGAVGFFAAVVVLAAAAFGQTDRRNPPLLGSDFMVDLARDYALSVGDKRTAADADVVRALLAAATRLEAKAAEPWRLRCELEAVVGGVESIAGPLEKYLELDPEHEVAFEIFLEIGPRAIQQVEKRREWFEAQLTKSLSPVQQAMVHTRLAEISLQQLDRAAAAERLDKAATLWPASPGAAKLRLQLLSNDASTSQRLLLILSALLLQPRDAQLAWDAGQLLHQAGVVADAQVFFDHALRMNAVSGAGAALPIEKLNQIALNLHALGRVDEAVRLAERVLDASPGSLSARMNLLWIHQHGGSAARALDVNRTLDEAVASITDLDALDVNVLAQAAWYYCAYDKNPPPQRVLAMAAAVSARVTNDAFARRLMGWALAINARADEAIAILRPIARDDPFAAAALAKLLKPTDEAAARQVLGELRVQPITGLARTVIDEVGLSSPTNMPASAPSDIADVLKAFDGSVLTFDQDPSRFLDVTVEFEDQNVETAEPWVVLITFRNRGSFPISFGPDGLVNASMLMSFLVEGDKTREYPALFSMHLDRVKSLMPGGSYRIRRSVDLGPLRRMSRGTPQRMQRVTLTAILDAQLNDAGAWQATTFGQMVRPAVTVRLPVSTAAAGIEALFRGVAAGERAARAAAVESLAQLLGEAQRARAKEPAYRRTAVPETRIEEALANMLAIDDVDLRVRTLDAVMTCGLNARLATGVRQCLEHREWAVRMMALRVLARQGESFDIELERVASDDADETVRAMAKALLEVGKARRTMQAE
ncbi:MAG: tetratricopeptide repeat protein [Phycisphaerae bacterium]